MKIVMPRKLAVLIGKDENVVAENYQEVAQFLALTASVYAIILKDTRMAPELQE